MKKSAYVLLLFGCFLIFHPLEARAIGILESTPEADRIQNAILVCQDLIGLPEKGIPKALLHNAQAIAIIPGLFKAAYIVGGEHGKGVLLVRREEGTWSNPVFVSMTGGSLGFQIGAQKADVILVFKDRKSVNTIARGKFTLGADASVAAGPVGRAAEASTDTEFEAEVYSYSKAKGLFAGVSIKGASLSIDKDSNAKFYRSFDLTTEDILEKTDIEAPQVAQDLRETVTKYAK